MFRKKQCKMENIQNLNNKKRSQWIVKVIVKEGRRRYMPGARPFGGSGTMSPGRKKEEGNSNRPNKLAADGKKGESDAGERKERRGCCEAGVSNRMQWPASSPKSVSQVNAIPLSTRCGPLNQKNSQSGGKSD